MKIIAGEFLLLYISTVFGASIDKPCTFRYDPNTMRLELSDPYESLSVPSNHEENVAIVPNGKQVRLECLEEGSIFRAIEVSEVGLFCSEGILFLEKTRSEYTKELDECVRLRKGSHAKTGELVRNGTCFNNATNIDVYITSKSGDSTHLYSVCFDETTSTTLYSKSYLDGEALASGKPDGGTPRPSFQDQGFFPFNVDLAYKQQKKTLIKLLGDEKYEEYFTARDHYFARGHLFPNGDPFYKYEKDGTFFYVNAVPQWQILNNGNWKAIEQSFHDMAKNSKSKINVYTGTHDVLTLKDETDDDIELWLKPKRFPVPKFMWKVAYNEEKDSAVALVQINNPYAKISQSDLLCEDICDQLDWLNKFDKEKRAIVEKGYSYCCDVNALREKIPSVPNFKYSKVLTNLEKIKVIPDETVDEEEVEEDSHIDEHEDEDEDEDEEEEE